MVVTVDGRARTYLLVAPAADAADRGLVLVLHGSGRDGAGFRAATRGQFDRFASQGLAVAYLDGHEGHWNEARRSVTFSARRAGCDDVAFARAVAARSSGGPVYAVGFSNGGQMVTRLVHEAPDLLAGAALIGATLPVPANFLGEGMDPGRRPMVLIHGTADPVIPYGGGRSRRRSVRDRGPGRSFADTAAYFAAANGITAPAVTEQAGGRPRPHGTAVARSAHRQDGRPPVVAWTVVGGGHVVPGDRWSPRVGRRTRALVAADAVAAGLLA